MPLCWVGDPSEEDLRRALATVAPALADLPMRINQRHPQSNPLYWSSSAWLDDRFVIKYAWSEVRAARLQREGVLLARLRIRAPSLPLPDVVAASAEPALLVTRAVDGGPLSWDMATELAGHEVACVADSLAGFLTQLHRLPVAELLHDLPTVVPTAQGDTGRLRSRFPMLVDERRARAVLGWCDWVDQVLAEPVAPEAVLVHGDLHGYNQVWDTSALTLQAIVDFEESGAADPHFDFRYLPGNAHSLDLLLAVIDAYERRSRIRLRLGRVMAWHVLTVLGDALWRTEAGVALPGGGDAPRWVDDLAIRLAELNLA